MKNTRRLFHIFSRQDMARLNWVLYGAMLFFVCLVLGLFAGRPAPEKVTITASSPLPINETPPPVAESGPLGFIKIGDIEGRFDDKGYTLESKRAEGMQ